MKIKVSEAKKALKTAVKGMLIKDKYSKKYKINPMYRMPLYLEGAPGIGKTEICEQVANELNMGYVSYSIVHHTKNSLLGLPVIKELPDGSEKYTEYTMPEIMADVYEQISEGKKEGILMLDEFNCCSETIMPIMLGFLQTKRLGEFSLPDGWLIVLCGNPQEYNKSARNFDMATMDRVRKIEIMYDTEDYLNYAKESGVHRAVIDYLTINPKDCYRVISERGKETECVTCRSFSNLSEGLKAYEEIESTDEINIPFIMQFIKSEEIASKFYDYYSKTRVSLSAGDIHNIYIGENDEAKLKMVLAMSYPEKYKLVQSIISYAVNHSIEIKENIETENEDFRIIEKGIGNIYLFLEKIDDSLSLSRMLTDKINSEPKMMPIIQKANIKQYNEDIMKMYDVA